MNFNNLVKILLGVALILGSNVSCGYKMFIAKAAYKLVKKGYEQSKENPKASSRKARHRSDDKTPPARNEVSDLK